MHVAKSVRSAVKLGTRLGDRGRRGVAGLSCALGLMFLGRFLPRRMKLKGIVYRNIKKDVRVNLGALSSCRQKAPQCLELVCLLVSRSLRVLLYRRCTDRVFTNMATAGACHVVE
jgi:hypothetical protein